MKHPAGERYAIQRIRRIQMLLSAITARPGPRTVTDDEWREFWKYAFEPLQKHKGRQKP